MERLAAAVAAVSRASVVCRHVQRELARVRAMTKDDASPVTVADFASQAIVARLLREHLPGVVLVAEESSAFLKQQHHSAHLDAVVAAVRESGVWADAGTASVLEAIDAGAGEPNRAGFWTLDPVDGTKGFLRGQQYCVSLAFIREGEVELGAVACPNLAFDVSKSPEDPDGEGTLFFVERGRGTRACRLGSSGESAAVLRRADVPAGSPARLAESVETAHTSHSVSATIMGMAGPTLEPVRLDSQAKYGVVARGQADAYLRLPSKKGYVERIWDHASGHLVAVEAGCVATDALGRGLDFSHGRGLEANKGIVVAPASLHGRLLVALEQAGIGRA